MDDSSHTLPSSSIFHELQRIHDTGCYFSPVPSLEDKFEQNRREMDRYLGNEPNQCQFSPTDWDNEAAWNEFLAPDEVDSDVNNLTHDIEQLKAYFDLYSLGGKIHVLPESPTERKFPDCRLTYFQKN